MMDDNDLTRKLLRESTVETPESFTDSVMDNIQDQKISVTLPKWQLYAFLSGLVLLSGSLYFLKGDIAKMDLTVGYNFDVPPMVFPVGILVFVLFAFNRFMALREMVGAAMEELDM